MRLYHYRAPAVPRATGTSRAAERRQCQEAADLAGVARCPRCRAPLVARMGCRGPYFHCACAESVSPDYRR